MEFAEQFDPQYVTQEQIDALIARIESSAADRRAGIFGPQSVSWKIDRESALFLGAGRAALLQLAHPWVAAALEQHSSVMANPIARFHNTFRIVFTMIFGSVDQAIAAARHLYRLHTHIQGEIWEDVARYPRGSLYQANEVAALLWVHATLIESAVLAYECVLPPLTAQERETYYAESKTLAGLFGIPVSALPSDWSAFVAYCRATEQSLQLGVTAKAREMAHGILAGAGSWIKPPRWYRALTTLWLPERFRAEFALRFDDEDADALDSAREWLPRIYQHLPELVRFVGPYQEARERLANRGPGLLTQLGNRFWIGEARLPFAPS